MVRLDLVREKVRRLKDTAAALRACTPPQASALAASRDALDLVSFRVYLGMQEAIDLASHIIADEGWGRRRACASTSPCWPRRVPWTPRSRRSWPPV